MECEIVIDNGGIFQSYEKAVKMFDLSTLNIFSDYFTHRPTFKDRGVAGSSIQPQGNVFQDLLVIECIQRKPHEEILLSFKSKHLRCWKRTLMKRPLPYKSVSVLSKSTQLCCYSNFNAFKDMKFVCREIISRYSFIAIRARSQTNRTPKHKKTEYKISMWHLLKKCQEKSICMLLYVMSSMDSFY